MSGTALDHPLVRDYLRDLDRALAVLPAERAGELTEQITAHLDEALAPGTTDQEVAAVLARLGRPADLATEALRDAPRAARRRRIRSPRLGWRRWLALTAALIIAAASAGYAIAMNTATPIQLANDSGWWGPWTRGPETNTQADLKDQSTVPIQSGQRQGFYITVINPSAWPETVLGVAPGQASPGSASAQVRVSPMNLDRGGFPTYHLRFYLPFTIPPQQTRALRVQWISDICLRPGQTRGIGRLALRVRIGWFIRTDVIQLPEGFYLKGPSRGPCTRSG